MWRDALAFRMRFASILAAVLMCLLSSEQGMSADIGYLEVRKTFSVERPGFGVETTKERDVEQAMAYGLVASAASIARYEVLAMSAADWLVKNAYVQRGQGWGLGWEWDAFGDGSVNPADTSYGITTALAVDGLLRTYELTRNAQYLDAAIRALESYAQSITLSDHGLFFWYSDQEADAINVPNVSAMMAGVFAMAGHMANRDDFKSLARRALSDLLAQSEESDGGITWRYFDGAGARYNDAVHASYIVYGALLTEKFAGGARLERESLSQYLKGFIAYDGTIREYRPSESKKQELRSRLWGVGMLAFTLQALGETEAALVVLQSAADYRLPNGDFAYRYDGEYHATRSTAHLLLAAAAVEARMEAITPDRKVSSDEGIL